MKAFININGIDLSCSELNNENGIESIIMEAKSIDPITRFSKIATFKLPNCELIENSGFEDSVIKYLSGILSKIEKDILEDAKKVEEIAE